MSNETLLYVARYAEGDMDEAEKTAFEAQLSTDEALGKQLETYLHIHQTLKEELAPSQGQQALRQTIAAMNQQYFKKEAKVVSLRPYIRLVSGIAAVLFIGLLLWAPWKSALYDSFAINEPIAVAERGNATQDDFETGAKAYNNEDFKTAATSFAKAFTAQPQNARYGYYYALSLTKTNQTAAARKILNAIYEGESAYKYEAAYAMALTYLQEKDNTSTKEWLNKIPEGSSRYEKATRLLKEL